MQCVGANEHDGDGNQGKALVHLSSAYYKNLSGIKYKSLVIKMNPNGF
jgi:hypothetical protein